jgi:hypothetical protein
MTNFDYRTFEHEALAYVPRFTEKLLPVLRAAIKTNGAEALARKFGMRG